MCRGYATLLLYSNVIIAVTLACSVYGREWLSTPVAIAALGLLAIFSFIPDRDWVQGYPVLLAELSPIRIFLEQGCVDNPGFHPALLAPPPTVLLATVPVDVLRPLGWLLVVAIAVLVITVGPGHRFRPGLDNFGAVVLKGDRQRGILGRLRGGATRRVEMAFFYENAPAWTARWGFPIRYALAALPFLLLLALLVGVVWGNSILPQRWDFFHDWKGPVSVWVGGGIVAFWGLLTVNTRSNVRAAWPLGRFRVRSETLLCILFVGLLGSLFLFQGLTMQALREFLSTAKTLGAGKPVASPAQVEAYFEAWWFQLTGMLLLVANLFLLGRVASRISDNFFVARIVVILGYLGLLLLPVVVHVALRETDLSESLAPLSYLSPAIMVPDGDRELWTPRPGWERFMTAQGILCGVLLVAFLAPILVRRRPPSGVAAALAIGLFGGGLAAQDAPPGSPLRVQSLVRGFDGVVFADDVDFFTAEIENVSRAPITVRYRVESDGGSWGQAECVLSPESTRTLRWSSVPVRGPRYRRRSIGEVRVVFEVDGYQTRSAPLDLMVLEDLQRQSQRGQKPQTTEQHLFVGIRGGLPAEWVRIAMAGSARNMVHCEARDLPLSVREFAGIEVVWLTAEALAGLVRRQQEALYHYLLLGGTAVFSGGLPAAELARAGRFATLLRPTGERFSRVGERQLRHVQLIEGRDVAMSWAKGGTPVPILNIRSLGAGHLAHVAFQPSAAVIPRPMRDSAYFWGQFDAGLPRGGFGLIAQGVADSRPSGDYSSLALLGGYYLIYGLGLSVGLFFFARRRSQRRRLWWMAVVLPLAFVALVPVLVASADSRGSLAEHTELTFLQAGSTHGVAARHMLVHSSGKQRHRVALTGTAPAVFLGVDPIWRRWWWSNRHADLSRMQALPLRSADATGWEFDFTMAPWTQGEVFGFDTVAVPEPLLGEATEQRGSLAIEAEVPAWLRGRPAYAILRNASGSKVVKLQVGADGAVRAALPLRGNFNQRAQLHRLFLLGARLQLGGAARTRGVLRLLLAFAPPPSDDSEPAWTSADFQYEQEVSRRLVERSAGRLPKRRIVQRGGRYFERLDHRVTLVEIPIVR
jgi:hypothetical protein